MPNALCHFEFLTGDAARCKAFYGAVFGWKFDDASMPGYTLVETGHEPSGGILHDPLENSPCINVYFKVENIERILENARTNGGKVLVEKSPIPGIGHFAMFSDPDGIVIGIMQPVS